MTSAFDRGLPRAARGSFPYHDHRTMEEVLIEESDGQERKRRLWRKRYRMERSSWRGALA